MKIKYDPEADTLYISFQEGGVAKTVEVDDDTMLDYDSKGNLHGIEILFVKERMPNLLKEIQIKILSG